jgi:P27 family predicted phage terminase small subunit
MAAPKRQPSAIAKLKGTYQKCRHEDVISDANALDFVHNIVPNPPDGFCKIAANHWTSTLTQAAKLYGYISFLDLKVFEMLCKTYAKMLHYEKVVSEVGEIYLDHNGNKKIAPEYQIWKDLKIEYVKLTDKFGFNPSARTSIKLEQQKQQTQTETFEL